MPDPRARTIEDAVIRAGQAYAAENGLPEVPGVGVFLVGFVLAASLPPHVAEAQRASYMEQLPEGGDAIRRWAEWILLATGRAD